MRGRITICMLLVFSGALLLVGVCSAEGNDYDYVWPAYDGIAQFEKDGKIGILDENGHVLVPAEYDSIEPRPCKNLRAVKKDGLEGFLDESWQLLHGKLFSSIFWLSEKSPMLYFVDESGLGGIMDYTGKIIHPAQWRSFEYHGDELNFTGEKAKRSPFLLVTGDDGVGILNDFGEWVAPPIDKNRQLFYSDGFARIEEGGGDVYKYGVIGPDGFILDPVWEDLEIHDGFFWASHDPSWEDQKWGPFNASGVMILDTVWDEIIKSDDSNTFLVYDGAHYGFFDATGREITPAIWDQAEAFTHGYAKVKTDTGRWGLINLAGELVVPATWRDLGHNTANRVAAKNDDGLWGLLEIDTNETVLAFEWDNVVPFFERLSVVKKNKMYGLLRDTNEMILPLQRDRIELWSAMGNSVYIIEMGEQYGYMAGNGDLITDMDFKTDDLHDLARAWWPLAEEGLYTRIPNAYKGNDEGIAFVDTKGDVVLSGDWYAADPFYQGYAVVRDMAWNEGLIDENGAVVIPIAYEMIIPMDDLWVKVRENGVYGWISPDFEVVAGIKTPPN